MFEGVPMPLRGTTGDENAGREAVRWRQPRGGCEVEPDWRAVPARESDPRRLDGPRNVRPARVSTQDSPCTDRASAPHCGVTPWRSGAMDIRSTHWCGLDEGKKEVVACVIVPGEDGRPTKTIRRFPTMTEDLEALARWLREVGCTHVAMESTGVYWQPIWNV